MAPITTTLATKEETWAITRIRKATTSMGIRVECTLKTSSSTIWSRLRLRSWEPTITKPTVVGMVTMTKTAEIEAAKEVKETQKCRLSITISSKMRDKEAIDPA